MPYYMLDADAENCVALGPKDPTLWDFFLERFDAPERFKDWVPFDVVPVTDHIQDPKKLIEPGDIANFNLTPISLFSETAIRTLGALLETHGELLPVRNPVWTYRLYHVTTVLDALDESKAVVERFASGKIMRVMKYAFRPEVTSGVDVFRIPAVKWQIFVSENIVQHVRHSKLTGFIFTPV